MMWKKEILIQSSCKQSLILFQIPYSSSEASKWMQDNIAKYDTGENTSDYLLIPQRMTQQHKLENMQK